MSRLSTDEFDRGHLKNGFDYRLQTWVLDFMIQDCGHPQGFGCHCLGRKHSGQDIRVVKEFYRGYST